MIHSASSQEAQPDSWFVIWTESRAEKKVEARIAALGLSPWLPTVKERHRWNDRWREVECLLFPRVRVFARTLRVGGVLSMRTEIPAGIHALARRHHLLIRLALH